MLSTATWLEVPPEIREKIRKEFNVPKSGGVRVAQGLFHGKIMSIVESDGTSTSDLSFITLEAMQKYMKSEETDYYKLFNNVVKRMSGKKYESSAALAESLANPVPTRKDIINAEREKLAKKVKDEVVAA